MKFAHKAILSAAASAIITSTVIIAAQPSQPSILPTSPGVTNPAVTQGTIKQTICVSGWTATIRPPASYTTLLKIQQLKQLHWSDQNTADYEEDHVISLELGGSPTDSNNLWPESYKTTPNAKDKDQVENFLKTQVCAGNISLLDAQNDIKTDWTKYRGNPSFGGVNNAVDNDDE